MTEASNPFRRILTNPFKNLLTNLLTFKDKTHNSSTRNTEISLNIETLTIAREVQGKNLKVKVLIKDLHRYNKTPSNSFFSNIFKAIFHKLFTVEIRNIEIEFALMDPTNLIFKLNILKAIYINKIILLENCTIYSFNKTYQQFSNSFNCVIELYNSTNFFSNDINIEGSVFDVIKILNYIFLFMEIESDGETDEENNFIIQIPFLLIKLKEKLLFKINKLFLDIWMLNILFDKKKQSSFSCEDALVEISSLKLLVRELKMKLNFLLVFFNQEVKREILNWIFLKSEMLKIKTKDCIKFRSLKLVSEVEDVNAHNRITEIKCYKNITEQENKSVTHIIGNEDFLNIYLTDQFFISLIEPIIIISNLISAITFTDFSFSSLRTYLDGQDAEDLTERLTRLKLNEMEKEFSSSSSSTTTPTETSVHLGLYFCVLYTLYLINNSKQCKIKRKNKILYLKDIFENASVSEEISTNNLIYINEQNPRLILRLFFIELEYTKNKGLIRIEINDADLLKNLVLNIVFSLKKYSSLNCYEMEYKTINKYLELVNKQATEVEVVDAENFFNLNNIEIHFPSLFKLSFDGDTLELNFVKLAQATAPRAENKNHVFWGLKGNPLLGTIDLFLNLEILKILCKLFGIEFFNNFMEILKTKPLDKDFILFVNYTNYNNYSREVIKIGHSSLLNVNVNLEGFNEDFSVSISSVEIYETLMDFVFIKASYLENIVYMINDKVCGLKIDYGVFKKVNLILKYYQKVSKYLGLNTGLQKLTSVADISSVKDMKSCEIKQLYGTVRDLFFRSENLSEYSIKEITTDNLEEYLNKKLNFKGFSINFMNLLIELGENEIKIKEWLTLQVVFGENVIRGGCVISSLKLLKIQSILKSLVGDSSSNTDSESTLYPLILKFLNDWELNFKLIILTSHTERTSYRLSLKYKSDLTFSIEENFHLCNYFYYILEPATLTISQTKTLINFLFRQTKQSEINIENIKLNINVNQQRKLMCFLNVKTRKLIKFNYTPHLRINNELVKCDFTEKKDGFQTFDILGKRLEVQKDGKNFLNLTFFKDVLIENNTKFEFLVDFQKQVIPAKPNVFEKSKTFYVKRKEIKIGLNTFKKPYKIIIGSHLIKINDIKKETKHLISMKIENQIKYFELKIKKEVNGSIKLYINPPLVLKNELFTGCVSENLHSVSIKGIKIKGTCLVCGLKNDCQKFLKLTIEEKVYHLCYFAKMEFYDHFSYSLEVTREFPAVFKLVSQNDKQMKINLFLSENNRSKYKNFGIKREGNRFTFFYKTLIVTNLFRIADSISQPSPGLMTNGLLNGDSSSNLTTVSNVTCSPGVNMNPNKEDICKKNHMIIGTKTDSIIKINNNFLTQSYTPYDYVNNLVADLEETSTFNLKINDMSYKLKLTSPSAHFLPIDKTNKDFYISVKPIFINNNVIVVLKLCCDCERIKYLGKYSIEDTEQYVKHFSNFKSDEKLSVIIGKADITIFSFHLGKFYEAGGAYLKYYNQNIDFEKVDLCPIPVVYGEIINDLYFNILTAPSTSTYMSTSLSVEPDLNYIKDIEINDGCEKETVNLFDYLFQLNKYTIDKNEDLTNYNLQKILETENVFIEESYKIRIISPLIQIYGVLGNNGVVSTIDYSSYQIDNPLMNGTLIRGGRGFFCVELINKLIFEKKTSNVSKETVVRHKLMLNDVIISPTSLTIYLNALSAGASDFPTLESINLIILPPIKIIAKLALATIPIELKNPGDGLSKNNIQVKQLFPSFEIINSNSIIINKFLNKCLLNSLGNNILKNIPEIGAGAIGKVFGKVSKGVFFNIKSLVNTHKNEIKAGVNLGIDFLLSNESEVVLFPERKFMFVYLQKYYDFYKKYRKLINSLSDNKLDFNYSMIKIDKQNRFVNRLINDTSADEKRRFNFPLFVLNKNCHEKHIYACLVECEIEYFELSYFISSNVNLSNRCLFRLIENLNKNPTKIIVSEKTKHIIKFYLIINTLICTSHVIITSKKKNRESYLILCKYFVYIYCFGVIKFKDIEVCDNKVIVKGKYILEVSNYCYWVLSMMLEGFKEHMLFLN
ncbi:hypothetical protein CDIK_1241 [Cucumispora dikerogammari]|nr:hypothetical protein CDIK_1241 [Cucumispora dikerogammari]